MMDSGCTVCKKPMGCATTLSIRPACRLIAVHADPRRMASTTRLNSGIMRELQRLELVLEMLDTV
jgi:hypothetical protein